MLTPASFFQLGMIFDFIESETIRYLSSFYYREKLYIKPV